MYKKSCFEETKEIKRGLFYFFSAILVILRNNSP